MPTLTAGRTPEKNEVGLQEDLAVGDRDHVRRDVGRDVAGLRLDDRQRGQRAAARLVAQLARALEQPRVQVEDVARECLAARWPVKLERVSAYPFNVRLALLPLMVRLESVTSAVRTGWLATVDKMTALS